MKKTSSDTIILRLEMKKYTLRKYRIWEIIQSLPAIEAKMIIRHTPNKLGITRNTWSDYLNLSITDKREIPSIKLFQIAQVLKVPAKDLVNIEIPQIEIPTENEKAETELV